MDKLSYLPSQGCVRYTSEFNPAIGDTIKIWGCSAYSALLDTKAARFGPLQSALRAAVEEKENGIAGKICTLRNV